MVIVLFSSLVFPVKAANIAEQLLNMPISLTSGKTVTWKQYQGEKPVYL
jgi:hypothetical protein